MFKGNSTKISYRMEKVPLRIGVKIRPDNNFYGDDAIETYK